MIEKFGKHGWMFWITIAVIALLVAPDVISIVPDEGNAQLQRLRLSRSFNRPMRDEARSHQ
jgi:hypothetical protein